MFNLASKALIFILSVSCCGCVLAMNADMPGFENIKIGDISRKSVNEIYGPVTQVISPTGLTRINGDCLYKFREKVVSESGKTIEELNAGSKDDLLLRIDSVDCMSVNEPLIRLIGINVLEYEAIQDSLKAFLKGDFKDGLEASSLRLDLTTNDIVPVSVSKIQGEVYEVNFRSSKGFVDAAIALHKSGQPTLQRLELWQ